jgi:hypothetical protein
MKLRLNMFEFYQWHVGLLTSYPMNIQIKISLAHMAKTPEKILGNMHTGHLESNPGTRKTLFHIIPYEIYILLKKI